MEGLIGMYVHVATAFGIFFLYMQAGSELFVRTKIRNEKYLCYML